MGEEETVGMYDEEVEEALDWGGDPFDFESEQEPALPGRLELVRIAKAEREIERLKGILDKITAAYKVRIEKHETSIALHRSSLLSMLEHGEKINYPDLGMAYLTTVKPRIEVADKAMAEQVAAELGCFTTVPDIKAMKSVVLKQVTEGTGEIPPGLAFVPERKTVTIKR